MSAWGNRTFSQKGQRLYFLISFFLAILIIFSFLPMSVTASDLKNGTRQETDDKTEALEWLETTLEITFEDPVRLTISGEFLVHEIYLPEYDKMGHFTADGIRKQYELETKSVPVNPKIELALNQKINDLFEKLINNTFPYSLRIIESPKIDRSSMYYPVDEDNYNPTVRVTQYCSYLELKERAYFSPSEIEKYYIQDLSDLIEGTLKMGGVISQNILIFANAGHKNTYILNVKQYPSTTEGLNEQLRFDQHPEDEFIPKKLDKIKFIMDRTEHRSSKQEFKKGVKLRSEMPNKQNGEEISILFELTMDDFDQLMINASKITVNTIKLDHILDRLPSNFSGIEYLSSDGIRLFYTNGIVNTTELEDEVESEINKIEREFNRAFKTKENVTIGVDWDLNSLTGLSPLYYLEDTVFIKRMGSKRPVFGYLFSADVISVDLIKNTSTTLIKGLLNSGAKAKLDLSIKTQYDYKFNTTLLEGFVLDNYEASEVSPEGRYTYLLSEDQTHEIIIASEHPATYTSSNAEINVDIDLHEIDILSFTEYKGSVKINADGVLHHIRFDDNTRFARALPNEFTMDFYNSDALRLILSEGLLEREELEEDMYTVIKENISKMLDEDLKIRAHFDESKLEFDGNIEVMDDKQPIIFDITASGKMRITEEKLVRMGSFITKQIELPLTGIKNWNVTYVLRLPKHIDIVGNAWIKETETEYKGPYTEQNVDNRYELKVTIIGDVGRTNETEDLEIEVVLDIDLTLMFFLNKIMIPIALTIILIIVVILIIILRRHKTKKFELLQKEATVGYEMEVIEERTPEAESPLHKDKFDKPKDRRYKTFGKSTKKPFESAEEEDYSKQLRRLAPDLAPGKRKKKKGKKRPGSAKKRKDEKDEDHMKKVARRIRRY